MLNRSSILIAAKRVSTVFRPCVSPRIAASSMASFSTAAHPKGHNRHITIEMAKAMPSCYAEMPNDIILNMAVAGDQEAREERLIRNIMAVDNVTWEDAQPQFNKIVEANRHGLFLATLPYKVAIATAFTAGIVSFPMIFDLDTCLWFNEHFVTTDVPEDKDLETPLEVGGWAWNWMEPPLGQISFFLLCMQYSRSQMQNLGAKPYTEWFLNRRASRICREFPKYSPLVLTSFSEGDSLSPHDVSETK